MVGRRLNLPKEPLTPCRNLPYLRPSVLSLVAPFYPWSKTRRKAGSLPVSRLTPLRRCSTSLGNPLRAVRGQIVELVKFNGNVLDKLYPHPNLSPFLIKNTPCLKVLAQRHLSWMDRPSLTQSLTALTDLPSQAPVTPRNLCLALLVTVRRRPRSKAPCLFPHLPQHV